MHERQKGRIFAGNNLKPFGKMKTILWIIAIGAACIGQFAVTLAIITIIIIAHFGNTPKSGGNYDGTIDNI